MRSGLHGHPAKPIPGSSYEQGASHSTRQDADSVCIRVGEQVSCATSDNLAVMGIIVPTSGLRDRTVVAWLVIFGRAWTGRSAIPAGARGHPCGPVSSICRGKESTVGHSAPRGLRGDLIEAQGHRGSEGSRAAIFGMAADRGSHAARRPHRRLARRGRALQGPLGSAVQDWPRRDPDLATLHGHPEFIRLFGKVEG